ncbi:MAG: hypothetical protein O3A38_00885, partial [Proteobacteria bacterium]|nr:hypothetical protein [Pseudomonadota bacterium]
LQAPVSSVGDHGMLKAPMSVGSFHSPRMLQGSKTGGALVWASMAAPHCQPKIQGDFHETDGHQRIPGQALHRQA